jgi:hypothetical protein
MREDGRTRVCWGKFAEVYVGISSWDKRGRTGTLSGGIGAPEFGVSYLWVGSFQGLVREEHTSREGKGGLNMRIGGPASGRFEGLERWELGRAAGAGKG